MRGDRVRAGRRAGLMRLAAAAVAVVTMAEWLHWRASRRVFPKAEPAPDGGAEAVVVLGFPIKRNGGVHPLQRWRCRIAARSMDSRRDGVMVFTGGAIKRDQPEAEAMARYARDVLGVPKDRIRIETAAGSTWQNIEFSIPLIEHATRIAIASDPMHAARARRYLRLQRPDLAARLAPAADYRFLEAWWLKVPTATHELAAIARRNAGRVIRGLIPRAVSDR